MFGCFCDPPDAPICHPQRGHPANLAPESVPKALGSRRWSAVMTPRDAGQRADDVVASHRAADGAGPSIEAARTYAGGSSGGAVVRFRAFRSAIRQKCSVGRKWALVVRIDLQMTSPTFGWGKLTVSTEEVILTIARRESKSQKIRTAKIFPFANWPKGESARAKSKRHRVRTPARPELFAETVTPEGFFL
jgi:hypothetical protein